MAFILTKNLGKKYLFIHKAKKFKHLKINKANIKSPFTKNKVES